MLISRFAGSRPLCHQSRRRPERLRPSFDLRRPQLLIVALALFATMLIPTPVAVAQQDDGVTLIDVADEDIAVGGGGFDANPSVVLNDSGADSAKDRQLTIWVRLDPGSCSSDVRISVTDPAGNNEVLAPFQGCPAEPGLLTAIYDAPATGAGEWSVAFDHAAERGGRGDAGGGYSVRAVRLDAVESTSTHVGIGEGAEVDLGNGVKVQLDVGHEAVRIAESVGEGITDLAPAEPAVAPPAQLEVGVAHVYEYRSVTEAGASERDQFATGLSSSLGMEGENTVDVTVARTDAYVEMTLLSRDAVSGDEVLSFNVVSATTRTWQESAVNYDSFTPGLGIDEIPSAGVSITEHGEMPGVIIERTDEGSVTAIIREATADPVGLEFVESVLDSFHFTVLRQASTFTTTETSRAFQDRVINSTVSNFAGGDGVVVHRDEVVPAADLAVGETRERGGYLVLANDGVLAATQTVDRVTIEPGADSDGFNDNRGDAGTEAKAASITDIRFQGSHAASAAFINDRMSLYNADGAITDQLDAQTAAEQRAAARAIRDLELMDEALAAFAQAPESSASVWLLADAIEAHPSRAGEVAELVGSAPTHDGALVAVSALVVAGRHAPSAQSALASVMADPSVAIGRRLTAAVNAVAIEDPSSELVSAAQSLAQDPEGAANASSVLAWSALAERSAPKHDDAVVFAHLSAAAANASAPAEASVAVAALENLGDQASLQLAYETAQDFKVYTSVTEHTAEADAQLKTFAECGHRDEVEDSGYVPGVDWGCTLGTQRVRAALDIRMGVTGSQGGQNGGASFLAEGKIAVKIYERNSDEVREEFEIARAVITSALDTYDGNNADDIVINVPSSENVQIGQVEREFQFQVRTILNSSDESSDDYWLVNKSAKVKCGLGAAFDLSLDEDGEPRLATNWDPWELPIQAGPLVIELKLHLRGSITFPTQVSMDICNFGLFESDYYPRDWKEGDPVDSAVVYATLSATITPTIKLDATVSVSLEIVIVKVGIEAEGTVIGLELPIRGSVQILDTANGGLEFGDELSFVEQLAQWDTPVIELQPCFSVAAHLYLLRMNFRAYGEFGFRAPPLPPFYAGGWITLYREEFDLGSWEWEPDVSGWPFLQNLLDGAPIIESQCSTIAPMVPIVNPVVDAAPGSFSQPRISGARIGLFSPSYSPPDTVLRPSADQFCIEQGFPGHSSLSSTDAAVPRASLWNTSSSSWRTSDGTDQARVIESLQCDLASQATPGSGQIGLCLSSEPGDWTLLYTGPYGGYVTTSATGGEFTPFLTSNESAAWSSSEDTQRLFQLAWYRVCVNEEGTVITANRTAPLDKDTMFQYLTPWMSGATAQEDCERLQPVLNLYDLIDCDRFDPTAFPDLVVNVAIDDGSGNLPIDPASAPGPTVDSGTMDIQFEVSNTGLFDMSEISVIDNGAEPATCDVIDLAVTESATCTATLNTGIDVDGTLTQLAGTQSRSVTVSGEYTRNDETRQASFSDSFFFTVAPSEATSFDSRVSLIGDGGTFDVSLGGPQIELTPGTYSLFPSITNTGQTALTVDSVTIPTNGFVDPAGCAGTTAPPGVTVSCDPQEFTVVADQDYAGIVEVSAGGVTESISFSYTGSGSAGGSAAPLTNGDLVISTVMKLSGDWVTEYDASSQSTAPVLDPFLSEAGDANTLLFTVRNATTSRTIHIPESGLSFSNPSATTGVIFNCDWTTVTLPDGAGIGWTLGPDETVDCAAQVRPGVQGAEALSSFTVSGFASDESTPLTVTSQNWILTGVAQLGFDNVVENDATNRLVATLANSSTYDGTLTDIAMSMTTPGGAIIDLPCESTTLATDAETECTYPLLSSMNAGTYTLTASATNIDDVSTTWVVSGASDATGSISYPADGSVVNVGENLNYSGLDRRTTPTGPTGTGTFFTGGVLPATDFDLDVTGGTVLEFDEDGTDWWAEIMPGSTSQEVTVSITEDRLLDAGGPVTYTRVVGLVLPGPSDFIVHSDVVNLPRANVAVSDLPNALFSDTDEVWITLGGQNAAEVTEGRILVGPHAYSGLSHGILHRVVERNGSSARIVPVTMEQAIRQAVIDTDFPLIEVGAEHDYEVRDAEVDASESAAVCENSPVIQDYSFPENNDCQVAPTCDPGAGACHVYHATGPAAPVSDAVFLDETAESPADADDRWFDVQVEEPSMEIPTNSTDEVEVNFSFRNAGLGGELDADWDLDHEFKLDIGPWYSSTPLRLNEFAAGFSVDGVIRGNAWAELALELESRPTRPIFKVERAFMVGIVPLTISGTAKPFYDANLEGRIDASASLRIQGGARMEWSGAEGSGGWVETPADATFDIGVEDVSVVATVNGDLTLGTEFGLNVLIADAIGAGIDFEPQIKFTAEAEASGAVDPVAQQIADSPQWAFDQSSFWKVERTFAIQPKLIIQVPVFDTPLGEAGSPFNSGIIGQLTGGMAVDAALLTAKIATHTHDELDTTLGTENAIKIVAKCMALVQLAAQAPQTSGISKPLAPNGQHWCHAVPIYMPGYDLQSAAYLRMAAIYANPGWVVQARVHGGPGDEDTTDNVHGREHSRSWLGTTTVVGGNPLAATNARLIATLTGLGAAGVAQPGPLPEMTWVSGCWSPRPQATFPVANVDLNPDVGHHHSAQCDEFPNASMASGGNRSSIPPAGFDHGNTRAIATLMSGRQNGAEGNQLKNFYATGSLNGIGGCNIQQANGVAITDAQSSQPMRHLERDWRPNVETLFLVVPIIEFSHSASGGPNAEAWTHWRTDWVCNTN